MKIFSVMILLLAMLVSTSAEAHHKPGHEDLNSKQSVITGNETDVNP